MAQIKYVGKNADHLYNDGDQVETDILHYTAEHEGDDYWDILKQDDRWPVFYHFTDMRENILGWYDFKPEAEVLEIGAGMGALTGLLCKKAKSVVSVELTRRRAEVIYNRHKKYDNLTILVGNFNEMKFTQRFDYITLIGVLEYAPGFTPDGETATFIKKIKSLLKPGGKLLIAIENRFGLKYWCGAGEDHTGKPYDGINGYPDTQSIRTFSRAELAELLSACGLPKQRFYYPLPDYKLPQVVYSDEYLPENKISSKIRQYCLGKTLHLADEGKLYRDITQNKAFPFMANSFFVECSDQDEAEKHAIFALFTPDRKEEYRITTVIYSDDTVRKLAVFPQGKEHLHRVYDQQRLYRGNNLVPYRQENGYLEMPVIHADGTLEDILCRLIRNGETEEARRLMDRFQAMILSSSELAGEGEEAVLVHGFLDLTFENCFVSGDQFLLFDQEWMEYNVSPEYIMFHAIQVLYWQNPDLEEIISFDTLISFYCKNIEKIPLYDQHNTDIILKVYSADKNALNFLDAHKGEVEQAVTTFYFGNDEEGFNEEKSYKISSVISQGFPCLHISEKITVPAGCSKVRIDPCEGYLCSVKNTEFICNGQDLPCNAVNGFSYQGITLFATEDPQFIVTLPPHNGQVLYADFTVRLYSARDSLFSKIVTKEQEDAAKSQEQLAAKNQEISEKSQELAAKDQEISEKSQELAAKDQEISEKNQEIIAKDQEINTLQNIGEQKENQISNLHYEKQMAEARCAHFEQEFNRISNSTSWKMTKPVRVVLDGTKSGIKKHKKLNLAMLSAKWRLKHGKEETKNLKNEYIRWNYPEMLTPVIERPAREVRAPREKYFSILVPLYNTPEKYLKEMIESVQAQTCPDWELCMADASDSEHNNVGKVCREYAKKDERIKYKRLEKNLMISGNTNEAAKMATGEYIALLDHDDLLAPNALEENLLAIRNHQSDILYSDEDHLFQNGQIGNPTYKPDWSPDLLYSQMYVCHFFVIRRELFEKVGGFRSKFDGSQDYDLMLRLSEETDKIHHVPRILYTWRESPTSTAANADSKPYAQYAGRDALDAHLKKVYGGKAHAEESEYTFVYDARYPLPEDLKVSIIIPMKDKWELTDACVKSIIEKSSWKNYEILILDNRSEETETKHWFDEITERYTCIRVIKADMEFNWSKLNNFGMKQATGDVFIFLNNDTVVISPDWMERLSEKAIRKDTGLVGPLLLYEDGTIQHAGVVVGIGGWADHIFKGMQPVHYGAPFISPMVTRNVMAVTGACMAVARETIEEIGPFDESFIICGSDVELGIRAHDKGLYNVYDASVRLYHLESKSRDSFIPEVDFQRSYEVYTPYREGCDPYFNPNLDPNSTSPRVRTDQAPGSQSGSANSDPTQEAPTASSEASTAPVPASEVGEVLPIMPRSDSSIRPRINLLIPSVDEKHVFGGIATAIKIYESLCERLGWDRRIITMDAPVDPRHTVLSKEYAIIKWKDHSSAGKQVVAFNDRAFATLPVRRDDVFVATGWWTAYTIQEVIKWQKENYMLKEPKGLIYFVQDFEPGFYPWSSRYLMADSTYQMDIPEYVILNAGLLKDYFDKQGHQFTKSWCFEPTLNEKLKGYLPKETIADKKKQILIYGRPGTPRNAFELICMSLREFISMNPKENAEWTFLAAGESFADVSLGSGAVLHSVGKLTLQEYANTMLETYAGISLMVSPHPSYPPLEMATFGIKTITNRFDNKDLGEFSENIFSVSNCAAKSIADTLNQICSSYTPKVKWNVNEAYVSGETGLNHIIDEVAEITVSMATTEK